MQFEFATRLSRLEGVEEALVLQMEVHAENLNKFRVCLLHLSSHNHVFRGNLDILKRSHVKSS